MTPENRWVFELQDIQGVIFECNHCNGRVVFPMGRDFDHDTIRQCPSCRTQWVYPPQATLPYMRLMQAIREVISGQEGDAVPFNTRVSVDAPR